MDPNENVDVVVDGLVVSVEVVVPVDVVAEPALVLAEGILERNENAAAGALDVLAGFTNPEKPLKTLFVPEEPPSASVPAVATLRLAFLITRVLSSSSLAVLNVPRSSGSSSRSQLS